MIEQLLLQLAQRTVRRLSEKVLHKFTRLFCTCLCGQLILRPDTNAHAQINLRWMCASELGVCSSSCGPVYLRNSDCNQYIEIACNYCMDANTVYRRFVERFCLWAGLIFVHAKIFRDFLLSIRTRKVRVVTSNARGVNTLGPTGAH